MWDPDVAVGVSALADVQRRRRHNDEIDGVCMMDGSSRSPPTADPAAHAQSAPDNEQRMHRQIDDIVMTVSVFETNSGAHYELHTSCPMNTTAISVTQATQTIRSIIQNK